MFLRTDGWRLPAIVEAACGSTSYRGWSSTASGRWQAVLSEVDAATRSTGEMGLQAPWAPAGPGWDTIDWDAVAGLRPARPWRAHNWLKRQEAEVAVIGAGIIGLAPRTSWRARAPAGSSCR